MPNILISGPCKVGLPCKIVLPSREGGNRQVSTQPKYQAQVARLANARAAKERKLLEEAIPVDRLDLPDLRQIIEIADYDTGSPVTY